MANRDGSPQGQETSPHPKENCDQVEEHDPAGTATQLSHPKMTNRWERKEELALQQMRELLLEDLVRRPSYPDVVGDRRLLRFLRGCSHNVEEAARAFRKHLHFRDRYHVDSIRNDILYRGKNHPAKFPEGAKILSLFPQIIISPCAKDHHGNPLSIEDFDFCPYRVLENVTKEEFERFLIYCLEFKTLVLEDMAHRVETENREKLAIFSNVSTGKCDHADQPWGVLLRSCFIRDFRGFGINHCSLPAQKLLSVVLELALDNYPELVSKSHMINVPWTFSVAWAIVRPFLNANTLAKVQMHGSDCLAGLAQDLPMSSIPEHLGGKGVITNEAFEFDLSITGPHYSPDSSMEIIPRDRNFMGEIIDLTCSPSSDTIGDLPPLEEPKPQLINRLAISLAMDPNAWILYLRLQIFGPPIQFAAQYPVIAACLNLAILVVFVGCHVSFGYTVRCVALFVNCLIAYHFIYGLAAVRMPFPPTYLS
jgi:CRAL/TRIO domain